MADDGMNHLLAPSGALRVVINLGNPILARLEDGEPKGISVDLAREFARRRGLEIVLCPVESAAKSVAAVSAGDADLGFFAVDPLRGAEVAFTNPYLLIEGWYLVRNESRFTDNASVDQPGVSIAVGGGSAYDLFLSRNITHAMLDRVPTSPEVVDHFVRNRIDVAAGIRQQLEGFCRKFLERPQKRLSLDTLMQRVRRIAEMPMGHWLKIGACGSCEPPRYHPVLLTQTERI